ncbi:MAG: right-handed parallel beta-helix repeat-containing protein [Candidatus Woesearchaeota archaeon]
MEANTRKRRASLFFTAVVLAVLLLAAALVRADVMLSETVSKSSSRLSRDPAISVGPNDVNRIHVVWEDNTELNESGYGTPIKNGPDRDILYIYKNWSDWSSREMAGSKLLGGVQVVTNSSMISSQDPDTTTDHDNITHIVWQGLTRPAELSADSHTTFLAHFDNSSSFNADYAAGMNETIAADVKSSSNAIHGRSVSNNDDEGKVTYNASGNIDMSKGTIEFWYNPQQLPKEVGGSVLFEAWNSSHRYFRVSRGYEVVYPKFYREDAILVDITYNESYAFQMKYNPPFELKRNTWHHIAYSYDLGNADCRLYFDGYLAEANRSCDIGPFIPSNFSVGMNDDSKNTDYPRIRGSIDELRISDTQRSASGIRQSAGQRDIFHRSLEGRTWSDITLLTGDDDNNSLFPNIAADRNQTLHVVWVSHHNDTSSEVRHKQKGSTGTWSSPETLSSAGTRSYHPDVAVDEDNDTHVIWQQVENSGDFSGFSTISYRKKDASGWSGIENLTNRTPEYYGIEPSREYSQFIFSTPSIAAGDDNDIHTAWSSRQAFPDDGLLFYLSFDNMDANVSFANKTTLSHQSDTEAGVEGFMNESGGPSNGYALHVNGSGHANYSAENNLNQRYGTMASWVKTDWELGSRSPGEFSIILIAYSAYPNRTDIDGKLMLYLWQCNGGLKCGDDNTSTLAGFGIVDNTSTPNEALYNVTGWNADEWHHLAATWNLSGGSRQTKLYVDGELADYRLTLNETDKLYFNETLPEIDVGNAHINESGVSEWGYTNSLNGTVDEVMIFGRILGESEISALKEGDMDIIYRQKNSSGWHEHEIVSSDSDRMSILPAAAAGGGQAYVAWSYLQGDYIFYSLDYSKYGGFFSTAFDSRNSTWQERRFVNDENDEESLSPDLVSERPGKIDIVWENAVSAEGSDIDIFYREYTNTTMPKINITSPEGGETITSPLSLSADVEDPDSSVRNVSFYYTTAGTSGGSLACTAVSSPFTCTWQIGATAEDLYNIKAVATSSDGGMNWSITDFIYLDTSESVELYDFNETGNEDGYHTMYKKSWKVSNDNTSWPDPTDSSTLGTPYDWRNASEMANLSSPDNQRSSVHIPLGCGRYDYRNAALFKFFINGTPGDILDIKLHWQGHGMKDSEYVTNMSIWNYNTSSWEMMDHKDFREEKDDDLIVSLSSDFSDYLHSENNTIFILVETKDHYHEPCTSSWGGSNTACPLYLSWNGTDYEFETEGILGIFTPLVEMPTYDSLGNVQPDGGRIRIAVKEIMNETTYMDSMELITVDHSNETEVMLDIHGNPHTIDDPLPVRCIDRFGDDCTGLINEADERPIGATSSIDGGLTGSRSIYDPILTDGPDGEYWVSNLSAMGVKGLKNDSGDDAGNDQGGDTENDSGDEQGKQEGIGMPEQTRDYIELELPEPEENNKEGKNNDDKGIIKLIISGSDSGLLGHSEAGLFSFAGDKLPELYRVLDNTFIGRVSGQGILDTASINVQVLDEYGQWIDYPESFENAMLGSYRTILLPLNRSLIRDSRIRLEMITYSYAIDYIGVDYSEDENMVVSRAEPSLESLKERDDIREVMTKGDMVELSFRNPPMPGSGRDIQGNKSTQESMKESMQRSYFLESVGYYHPGETGDAGEAEKAGKAGKTGESKEAGDTDDGETESGEAESGSSAGSSPHRDSSQGMREEFIQDQDWGREGMRGILDAVLAFAGVENGLTYARMMYDHSYAEERMIENYLTDMRGVKHGRGNDNTLYTDYMRVSVSSCVSPYDGLQIWENTSFCENSVFSVKDEDENGRIIEIMADNITVDCAGSTLGGGGSQKIWQNEGKGTLIGTNFTENVHIRNCTLERYGIGIGMNYSRNIHIYNNTVLYSYLGIGGDHTNGSIIRDNIVKDSFYVGVGLTGDSRNNTIANNTVLDPALVGYALEGADHNTMEFNTANGSDNKLNVGGLVLTMGASYNTIRNNSFYNLMLGVGMADVGSFLDVESYGTAGMFNNFTSNTATGMDVNGIGLLYPYPDDYYNYFDRNNIIEGERVHYYINLHGNESDYVQISDLNLTAENISTYMGKITLINCSYVNITRNNVSSNFYGMLVRDSDHIRISGNRAYDNGDLPQMPLVGEGAIVGVGYAVMNSHDVVFSHNNATGNYHGYYIKDSFNIAMRNNTAIKNSWTGFLINGTNRSVFINNSAELNDMSGFHISHSRQNTFINNTAKDGMEIGCRECPPDSDPQAVKRHRKKGFYFGATFNNTIKDNKAFNCSHGFFMNMTNETFANNTAVNNTIAGITFYNCLNRSMIDGSGASANVVENNTGAGYLFWGCNNTLAYGISTSNNNRTGFEIYDSFHLTISEAHSEANSMGFFFNSSRNNTVAGAGSVNSTSHELYFHSSKDNMIVDSVIINNVSGNDVFSLENSWNYLLNTSLNESNFGNSSSTNNVSVQWYLDLYVADNESVPVAGADIWLNDTLGNEYSHLTDRYAEARLNLTDYTIKGDTKTYYNNYTWNITKAGYISDVSMVNMSENRDINVTIDLLGGIPDTTPPTNPIVYDGYDYTDHDWTNNATTLLASWSNSTDRHLIFYAYRVLENGTCIPEKCAPTDVGRSTQISIKDLSLKEGYNYSIGVRARDSLYYYTPFIYTDGIITDFTAPSVTVNSTTHPNSSRWYSSPNVTLEFYGNDSLSGVSGYSFVMDRNSGTGPDLVEETRSDITMQEMANNGYGTTLRANSSGQAFAAFTEVEGNISEGDDLTVKVALREDISDTIEEMPVEVYLVPGGSSIKGYDIKGKRISNIRKKPLDISHKNIAEADTYSFSLTATKSSSGSFYVVVASDNDDDNNTHNITIAGSDSNVDNTTSSFMCGESEGCTNTTLSADYAVKVIKTDSRSTWRKTYTNLGNGIHWFHVRAKDRAGNWGNPAHYRIKVDAVNGTPEFTRLKPAGYIATTSPALVAETDEYTTCYYNTTNVSYTKMESYDGIYHEKELSGLSEGTHTYSFNCTDRAGNSGYNDTTFIVDPDAAPDDVSIHHMTNYTVGKPVSVDVNVTKDYDGVAYGLGELADHFTVNLTNSSGSYSISSGVKDMGNGVYTVSFNAPVKEGEYTLTVEVRGVSDTEAFSASTHTLTIRYSSGRISGANAQDRMTYSRVGTEYIIGLAGDSPSATSAGSGAGQIQIDGPAVNDNLFMFITKPTGDPGQAREYIRDSTFTDIENPSFGYPLEQEEHVLSAMLEYDDISIVGDDKVQSGRYTLLIKNEGVNKTTGKKMVSVSII